jgi:hypothetical protein
MTRTTRRPTKPSLISGSLVVAFWAALAVCGSASAAELVRIPAGRDATLIESPDGARANGAGDAVFAGRTNEAENALRRAVVFFDLAAQVPRQAIITDAKLVLYVGQGNPAAAEVAVHRLLASWTEGPSTATGGGGAPAVSGDVTWLDRSYDVEQWQFPGGDFVPAASATVTVGGPGFYAWQDSPLLRADVRQWQKAPNRNFGWVLVGDEWTSQSSKRIASRENATVDFRPVLIVEYELPPGR